MRSQNEKLGPAGARAPGALTALLLLAAVACDSETRATRITDPDTGADFAHVISMDFTKKSDLPDGFTGGGTGTTYIFGPEIRFEGRNLARPPEGYYYAVHLLRADGTSTPVADLRGPAPDYATLTNADSEVSEPLVTETLIPRGVARDVDDAVDFTQYTEVAVVLVAKSGGAGDPLPIAARGTLPAALTES